MASSPAPKGCLRVFLWQVAAGRGIPRTISLYWQGCSSKKTELFPNAATRGDVVCVSARLHWIELVLGLGNGLWDGFQSRGQNIREQMPPVGQLWSLNARGGCGLGIAMPCQSGKNGMCCCSLEPAQWQRCLLLLALTSSVSAGRMKKGWRCSGAVPVGTAAPEMEESLSGLLSVKTVFECNSKVRDASFALLLFCLADVGVFLVLLTFLSYIVPFFPVMLTVPSAYLSPAVRTRISISNLLCLGLF